MLRRLSTPSLLLLFLPSLLGVLPYLNDSLFGAFVYDDKVAVQQNPDVAGQRPVAEAFFHDFWGNKLWDGSAWTHSSYRPLSTLTFRLDTWLKGGHGTASTFLFHASNLFYYFLSCLAATLVFHKLMRGSRWAGVASLIFAMNPIHSEVTVNITSRAETLASIFVFLAWWSGLQDTFTPSSLFFTLTKVVVLTGIGTFFKENALIAGLLVAPLLLIHQLYGRVVFQSHMPEGEGNVIPAGGKRRRKGGNAEFGRGGGKGRGGEAQGGAIWRGWTRLRPSLLPCALLAVFSSALVIARLWLTSG